jgi:hypothetical protein
VCYSGNSSPASIQNNGFFLNLFPQLGQTNRKNGSLEDRNSFSEIYKCIAAPSEIAGNILRLILRIPKFILRYA